MSPRRTEVAGWIALGLSNKQIARKMGISPATVKQHAVVVFKQLGVSNRTQAALMITKEGV